MTKESRQTEACGIFWLMIMHVRVSDYVCNMRPDVPENMGAKLATGEWSEHAKALTTLTDGQLQHPVHLFI